MAEHAWNKGERFGALFMALLQKQRFAFITNGDEDRARKRLREHRDQEFAQTSSQEEGTRSIQDLIQPRRMPGTSKHESRLSPEGEFVEKCIRARQASWSSRDAVVAGCATDQAVDLRAVGSGLLPLPARTSSTLAQRRNRGLCVIKPSVRNPIWGLPRMRRGSNGKEQQALRGVVLRWVMTLTRFRCGSGRQPTPRHE